MYLFIRHTTFSNIATVVKVEQIAMERVDMNEVYNVLRLLL